MKKIFLLINLGLLFAFSGFSETPESKWANQSEGGNSLSISTAYDSHGNTFIAGSFSDSAVFGNTVLHSKGMKDAFVAKIDSDGKYEWAISFGGLRDDEAKGISVDASGNIFVIGSFRLQVEFGDDKFTTQPNYSDIFISKLNSDGEFVWTVKAGGPQEDKPLGIDIDASGNIYVTGFFTLIADFGNIELNVQIYTGGGGTNQLTNIFVTKLDKDGNFIWAEQAGGKAIDEGRSISVNSQGEIFIAGIFGEDAYFDDGNIIVSTNSSESNSFVAKFSNDGTCQWVKEIRSDNSENLANSVVADNFGNCFVVGEFTGDILFVNTLESSSGDNDIFVAKFKNDGSIDWYNIFGSTGADAGLSVDLDDEQNIYLGGYFSNSMMIGNDNLTSNGAKDLFVIKLGDEGETIWAYSDGSTADDYLYSINVIDEDEYVITGTFEDDFSLGDFNLNSSSSSNVFTAKYSKADDNNGNDDDDDDKGNGGDDDDDDDNGNGGGDDDDNGNGGNDDDDNNTSIVNSQIISYDLYPNPAESFFVIDNFGSSAKIIIKDAMGREVISSEINSKTVISTEKLSNGMYFVELKQGNNVSFKRLIINK